MRTPLPPVMPARRRLRRRATLPAAILTGALVGGCLAATVQTTAFAAAEGSYTIGKNPIALNQATDPEMGRLVPTADATQNGMYGTLANWSIIPLHAAVARNGHLVTFGTLNGTATQGGLVYDDWNPAAGFGTGAHSQVASMNNYDSFCNSLVELSDGRFLMVGGNSTTSSMTYNPFTRAQAMGADLAKQRWYSTALRLPDGRVIVLGGGNYYNGGAYLNPNDTTGVAITPEVRSASGAWTQLTGATSAYAFGPDRNRWWYPRAFNGPNGSVVGFSGDRVWTLSTAGAGSVQESGTLPYYPGVSGSQVMFAPGRILIAGGGQQFNGDASPTPANAAVLDVNGARPVATATNPMAFGRNWLNLTVLPSGEVFANGGTTVGVEPGDANSVRQAEIWNPATGQWRTAATAQRTRTYHSTSLVLPSGAVFTGGGGAPGPQDNLNAELYYPAYLFSKDAKGAVQWASRPAISSISGSATYGGRMALNIADGRKISSATLISLPSVTHSENTDQRRIPLQMTQRGSTVTATVPQSVNTVPPGDYELTVTDSKGVPSAAQIITLRRGAAGLVTVGSGVSTPSGASKASKPSTATGKLTVGDTIGILADGQTSAWLTHNGTNVRAQNVSSRSSLAVKRASSWIVRRGLSSKGGYSFESVDKPGYYLVAPASGTGTLSLARKSGTSSFAARASFASVAGVSGRSLSIRVVSNPRSYLQLSRGKVTVGVLAASPSSLQAATLQIKAALARR